MRREWIEMADSIKRAESRESPSMRREWIEIEPFPKVEHSLSCLPPCGGSGLKYLHMIETYAATFVSLHAEGVD